MKSQEQQKTVPDVQVSILYLHTLTHSRAP